MRVAVDIHVMQLTSISSRRCTNYEMKAIKLPETLYIMQSLHQCKLGVSFPVCIKCDITHKIWINFILCFSSFPCSLYHIIARTATCRVYCQQNKLSGWPVTDIKEALQVDTDAFFLDSTKNIFNTIELFYNV